MSVEFQYLINTISEKTEIWTASGTSAKFIYQG